MTQFIHHELHGIKHQTGNGLAILQMAFNDFVNIFAINVGIPNALWINDQHRAFRATVKATRRIDARLAIFVQTEFFSTLFGVIAQSLRIKASATGLTGLTLIDLLFYRGWLSLRFSQLRDLWTPLLSLDGKARPPLLPPRDPWMWRRQNYE